MKLISVGVVMMWVVAFGGAGCGGTDDGSGQLEPDQSQVSAAPSPESPGTVSQMTCDCPLQQCDDSACLASCGGTPSCQNMCGMMMRLCMQSAAYNQILCMQNCIAQNGG